MELPVRVSVACGESPITLQTGKLAKLADGAAVVSCGETVVLATVVSTKSVKPEQDFLPLQVEYRERAAAAGRIPGGYFRREGRPTEKEILTARMIDRPLRPLFPKGYFYETQVILALLSADAQNDPDILAINAASLALMVSDIPFAGPVGAVRLGRLEGKWTVNPTHRDRQFSDLDLVYVGTETEALMIEGSARELPEADFQRALEVAQEAIEGLIRGQKEIAAKVGRVKRSYSCFLPDPQILQFSAELVGHRLEEALYLPQKQDRESALEQLRAELVERVRERFPTASDADVARAFTKLQQQLFRHRVLEEGKRCDGRRFDEVRPLSAETGILPRVHGTALFARGETQALCMATLASLSEAQEIDAYGGGETTKRFLLHYNFPPFSVGEVGRIGGQSRREIGHGALAERSIFQVVPPESSFPYAIRVNSEILESNGSTSMATVCGGTLALMDAGVPLKAPVAGISVGLVTEPDEAGKIRRHVLLTDILGLEDHYGDMDFKLAGTEQGVTGFQLDLKLPGIPIPLLQEAIDRAAAARRQILAFMQQVMQSPRKELSKHAPRIDTLKIHPDKIGLLIGPGGKNIKRISAESGAEISVEDDGTVRIYSPDSNAMAVARELVEEVVGELVVGGLYRGRVSGIKDFGCFVEIRGKGEGLVHISELAETPVRRVEEVVRMGEEVWIKCIGIDDRGRYKFSRKAALRDKRLEQEQTAAS
ncbi:polyribonucleotide nucleotidyltransferase [Methylacidimicrobium cyclopophantes]|uniref:Polyribonucleotide nucleotidyltransferase n=1 Tax=Methylacidimicrobium cyclopophantes TaxID=1041766 RepID=A0A5E6MH02_9BACT|nr:polyribonucleotide nucleotidyltransferase [Methylacidimicrobium cyclopophantes]VVM07165.1 polyribonucleotide nucleotidyltransferase [Methylacidimicrobium cyclopophantes]